MPAGSSGAGRELSLVFCVGLDKTGTTSLCETVANSFGLPARHFEGVEKLCEGLDSLDADDGRFDGECIVADWPLWENVENLARLYPDATYVITTRNIDDWLFSRCIHRLSLHAEWGRGLDLDVFAWSEEFERHHGRARDVLARCRVFELNVCDDPPDKTIETLTDVLGRRPVEGGGLEWSTRHTGESNLEKIARHIRERRQAIRDSWSEKSSSVD